MHVHWVIGISFFHVSNASVGNRFYTNYIIIKIKNKPNSFTFIVENGKEIGFILFVYSVILMINIMQYHYIKRFKEGWC